MTDRSGGSNAARRVCEREVGGFSALPFQMVLILHSITTPAPTRKAMLSTILSVLRDPVPYRGGLGIFAIVTLERLNAVTPQ
jgi:hypothetical protein